MNQEQNILKPILKWAGGKRQLLDSILPLVPDFTTYYEPFAGGAAVLFALQPKRAVISDQNHELINIYNVIKDNPDELVEKLNEHKMNNSEKYFYQVRSLDRCIEYSELSNVEKAARIIYLNQTCYSGLYRVNKSGQFNTPWGKYKNPSVCREEQIRSISNYLNSSDVKIVHGDYRDGLKYIRKTSFVYFDPPYVKEDELKTVFTNYTSNGFTLNNQIELKEICDKLNEKGVKFLISNSNCEFIRDLYKDYSIKKVAAKRNINASGGGNRKMEELLIKNY